MKRLKSKFKVISEKTVWVTDTQAIEMLKVNNKYTGQREVKKAFVDKYAKLMQSGSFRSASSICFVVNKKNGKKFIVDGQHRLYSIATLKECAVQQTIITYECANSKEIAELYGSFNTDAKRLIGDISKAYADLNGVNHWNKKVRGHIVSFADSFRTKPVKLPKSYKGNFDERSARIKHHIASGNFLSSMHTTFIHKNKRNSAFTDLGTSVCMLLCFEQYGEKIATDFWTGVLTISQLVPNIGALELNDPRRCLRTAFTQAFIDRKIGWWNSDNIAKTRMVCMYQTAFDKFIKGGKMEYIPYTDEDVIDWEPIAVK